MYFLKTSICDKIEKLKGIKALKLMKIGRKFKPQPKNVSPN